MKKILKNIWEFIKNLFRKQNKKTKLKWRGIDPFCITTKNK